MKTVTLLVLSNPTLRYLQLLEKLPENTTVAAGTTLEAFENTMSSANVVLCGLGMGPLLEELWPHLPGLEWVHSFSAGIDHLRFPALLESPVTLTNGRGAFSPSLGEFAIGAILFFAKDFRRMVASQEKGEWDPFDVEWVTGKTLGIVGYGDIGRAVAARAHALGMKVVAARRHPALSEGDTLLDRTFPPDDLADMLPQCDYVVCAAPLTGGTRGLIGEPELRALQRHAVVINVGRGPVIVESAMIRALEEHWIKGAALDVFDEEPLPAGHPFYRMKNLLLSPHIGDHTPGWTFLAMELFLRNFERFSKDEPLLNIVDKTKGY